MVGEDPESPSALLKKSNLPVLNGDPLVVEENNESRQSTVKD